MAAVGTRRISLGRALSAASLFSEPGRHPLATPDEPLQRGGQVKFRIQLREMPAQAGGADLDERQICRLRPFEPLRILQEERHISPALRALGRVLGCETASRLVYSLNTRVATIYNLRVSASEHL